ncbi:uncharacterized protein LOC128554405 [Mercenaria mercenaria]|uniref:uncharacterized protein LOC128554405 n=1 Tax=Mercenaria mercenaria TaxID=6596 RepID=UPI00234E622E|nr:uncharacterized protein LOC128554405 [Mercenaria mercenaria]
MQVSGVGNGCFFNQTCMAVNSTWADGCRTRKCVLYRTGNMTHQSIAPISAGCDDEGVCRKVGYKKVTDTCMHYKCKFSNKYKDAFFSLDKGACRATDSQCHDIGKRWTEKRTNICFIYKCEKKNLGYLSKMLEQKCLDSNGKCQPVGSTGFPAKVKGVVRKDCSCVQSTTQISGIAIRCKG